MSLFTIEAPELAAGLGINRHAILQYRAGSISHPLLTGLPAPLMSRPRLVWLRADIEAWIESRRTFRASSDAPAPAPVAKRGPGRPRKTGSAS
ncbi:MAG: hypothetical protein ACYC0P_03010 [Thiobacillus sp.]